MQRFAPDSEAKAGSRWEEDELPFTLEERLLLVEIAAATVLVVAVVSAGVRRTLGRSRQRESREAS